jgi:phosphatidylglycerol lysyltransferase
MRHTKTLKRHLHLRHDFAVEFLSFLVGAYGLFILATTLLDQVAARHSTRLTDIVIDLPLLIGVSLLYLSTQLRRRKRTAWLVTVLAYTFYFGLGMAALVTHLHSHQFLAHELVRSIILPIIILGLLLIFEREFVVKSDVQGFRSASRFAIIILILALIYGVAGFLLLDESDFHQEIGFGAAIHYTVDQFDLTTARPLHAYTKRAHLFVDSLSFVSLAAVAYAALALFQPLRGRFFDQSEQRQRVEELLTRYGGRSEDFFKLWPADKQYYFSRDGQAVLAFRVTRGVALCLGDPSGNVQQFDQLVHDFVGLCFSNDWLPATIHAEPDFREIYQKYGYSLQKIGQEAIVNIEHFQNAVRQDKYFRQIDNKFSKLGFTYEMLQPPHHQAVLARLKAISDQWLARDGHDERGFAMGYYNEVYLQRCRLMVARDAAGTIQVFINQIPADYDKVEADFDLLRQADKTPGNISDYLLMNFINMLHEEGYQRLNMGLCALTGLDEPDKDRKGLIDSVLKFAYANGDRFFSFSGLYRFKNKYQPEWRDRYIVYQGGVRGFSRTTNALLRAMRVK